MIAPATQQPGRLYGYIRVSTPRQAESGLGLEAQKQRVFEKREIILRTQPELLWVGIFADEGYSAYKIEFRCRKNGRNLDLCLRAGDHLIIPLSDRSFRNLKDKLICYDEWAKRGVTVYMLDLPFDTSTPSGRMQMQVMGSVAEYSSAMLSARIKEIAEVRRAAGLPPFGRAPPGKKWTGPRGRRHFTDDLPMRALLKEILRLRRVEKLSFPQVADEIEKYIARMENRKVLTKITRPLSWQKIEWWAHWEKKHEAEEEAIRQAWLLKSQPPMPPEEPA